MVEATIVPQSYFQGYKALIVQGSFESSTLYLGWA